MKQPIEPKDIRVGDLVRAESKVEPEAAHEGRVRGCGETWIHFCNRTRRTDTYDWFLLDRPQPTPSKKAMVAADAILLNDYPGVRLRAARRIDEAWAKEGLT